MPARLWTAALLLAAVFTMHGAQCTAAADNGGSVSSPAHTATAALASGHAHVTLACAVRGDLVAGAPAAGPGDAQGEAHAVAGTAGALVAAGHGTPSHHAAAHLWTVCLAVLAAGLAALVALFDLRPVRTASPVLAHLRVLVAVRPAQLRPPDLSALCLLRI